MKWKIIAVIILRLKQKEKFHLGNDFWSFFWRILLPKTFWVDGKKFRLVSVWKHLSVSKILTLNRDEVAWTIIWSLASAKVFREFLFTFPWRSFFLVSTSCVVHYVVINILWDQDKSGFRRIQIFGLRVKQSSLDVLCWRK